MRRGSVIGGGGKWIGRVGSSAAFNSNILSGFGVAFGYRKSVVAAVQSSTWGVYVPLFAIKLKGAAAYNDLSRLKIPLLNLGEKLVNTLADQLPR